MNKKALLKRRAGIAFWRIEPFEKIGCRAVFFLRNATPRKKKDPDLNFGLNSGEPIAEIVKHREQALKAAGMGPYEPVFGKQVHGTRIGAMNDSDRGKGWKQVASGIARTDGLITADPGIPLGITTADCLPILMAEESHAVVAAIHVGWRGLVQGMIKKSIGRLKKSFHINPGRLWVAIGPAIGPKKFIVKGDTLVRLQAMNSRSVIYYPETGEYGFDLWKAAKEELMGLGVLAKKIITIRECTASHPGRYYSYRKDQTANRQMALVQILIKRK